MSYSVEFEKVGASFESIKFLERCYVCQHLSAKINENLCSTCKKYLSYVKENDVIIISFSNFFQSIVMQKNAIFLSWYDFAQVERVINGVASQEICWKYYPERLSLYVDMAQSNNDSINKYSNFIAKICYKICKLLNTHAPGLQKLEFLLISFFNQFLGNDIVKKHVFYIPTISKITQSVTPVNRVWIKNELLETCDFLFEKPL